MPVRKVRRTVDVQFARRDGDREGWTSAKYTIADGVTAWKWRSRELRVSRVGCWGTSGGRNTLKKVNKKLVSEGMSMRIVGQRNLRFVQSPMI